MMQYFDAQRRSGGKFIVVDPRRTVTAEAGDYSFRLIPGPTPPWPTVCSICWSTSV